MKILRQTSGVFLFTATLVLFVPTGSVAAEKSVATPENAIANQYGRGWRCLQGYVKKGPACRKIDVPANAYLKEGAYPNGWACHWGFREVANQCEAIAVPANAYLSPLSGGRWLCERGYRKFDDSCIEIEVPVNGYLDERSSGRGWRCQRGYKETNRQCVRVEVPTNAHIDYSGNTWTCNPPFRRRGNECLLP